MYLGGYTYTVKNQTMLSFWQTTPPTYTFSLSCTTTSLQVVVVMYRRRPHVVNHPLVNERRERNGTVIIFIFMCIYIRSITVTGWLFQSFVHIYSSISIDFDYVMKNSLNIEHRPTLSLLLRLFLLDMRSGNNNQEWKVSIRCIFVAFTNVCSVLFLSYAGLFIYRRMKTTRYQQIYFQHIYRSV